MATAARTEEPTAEVQLQVKSRMVNQESLKSTRRMVTMVAESEDAGAKTLAELDRQGEQLDAIESTMEKVDANIKEADDALTGCQTRTGKRSKKDRVLHILCCRSQRNSRANTGTERDDDVVSKTAEGDRSVDVLEIQVTAYCASSMEGNLPAQQEFNPDKRRGKLRGIFADYLPWPGRKNTEDGERKPAPAETSNGRYVNNILNTKEEEEMNQNLAVVDNSVHHLHKMATTMERELDVQNEQLDRMNTRQRKINANLTETRGKIDERLGDSKKKPLISGRVVLKKLLD